jgi:hypothetical protein
VQKLIKIAEIVCTKTTKHCKRLFTAGDSHKAYVSKTGLVVMHESFRVPFDTKLKLHLRSGKEVFFQDFFTVKSDGVVNNKQELNAYLLNPNHKTIIELETGKRLTIKGYASLQNISSFTAQYEGSYADRNFRLEDEGIAWKILV